MKKLFSLAMLMMMLSSAAFCQDKSYGKFLGSISTAKFVGNSMVRLYEKQVELIEVTSNGQNQNTTLNFKFSPCSASADFLAHTQSSKPIQNGLITVMEKNPFSPSYTRMKYQIYFEDASMVSCSDTRACNNVMATSVNLKPQRICWIYYNYEAASGKSMGTTTNGFDSKSGQSWSVTPPNF